MNRSAYLVLENGTVFEGKAFGAEKETTGELVFTTAMTGYLETLTDPSYFGQVVLQTFPLIGNYGVIASDFETDSPCLKGYIVREWCQEPSNFRCEGNLDAFLKEKNVPGICGIDTRALTRIVREVGVMACRIQYTPDVTDELLDELKSYRITKAETVGSKTFSPAEVNYYKASSGYSTYAAYFGEETARAMLERNLAEISAQLGYAKEQGLSLSTVEKDEISQRAGQQMESARAQPRRHHALQRPRRPGGEHRRD